MHIAILGGGIAGLSVGYYAQKNGLPFTVLEANSRVGGNAVTLTHGDFLFDSGAHRFHDKNDGITEEIKKIVGNGFRKITAPSQIYDQNKFIDFPLSPLNLLKKLGPHAFAKAGLEVVKAKLKKNREPGTSFESFARNTYGKSIAERFLLNYSEKLWGRPCAELSPEISGKRLEGLDLKTFLIETLQGTNSKTQHLDGAFYYPDTGIGVIAKALEKYCGKNNILTNSKVTKIFHQNDRISGIEMNHGTVMDVDQVVSTLPLHCFLNMMDPLPPNEILSITRKLRYRNVILITFFINREFISKNASIYFPSMEFPFTRVYEPKKRSPFMAPPDKTSIVAEIPCQEEEKIWDMTENALTAMVQYHLCRTGLVRHDEIIASAVHRMYNAYPILDINADATVRKIHHHLHKIKNLKFSGRNGCFTYIHIHDLMKMGQDIVAEYRNS